MSIIPAKILLRIVGEVSNFEIAKDVVYAGGLIKLNICLKKIFILLASLDAIKDSRGF